MARRFYHPGDEPIEGYKLIHFIGSGGFGQVWKAAGPGGIDVALKIVNDLSRNRGGKELRALHLLKHIRHPHLVPIMGFWCRDETGTFVESTESTDAKAAMRAIKGTLMDEPPPIEELIMVMALAEKSLFDRLQECQKDGLAGIPVAELLEYMIDTSKAIDHLNIHHQIQHCDIKPQNLLLQSNVAQVADFGLAKLIGNVRQTSMSAGSVAYGPPEIFNGNGASQSTDQYSLAVSYYELRSGRLPYDDQAIQCVLNAKTDGELDFTAVAQDEQMILHRATSVNPPDRYDNVTEMVRELAKCQSASVEIPRDSEAINHWKIQKTSPVRTTLNALEEGTVGVSADQTIVNPSRISGSSDSDVRTTDSDWRTTTSPIQNSSRPLAIGTLLLLVALGGAAAFLWFQTEKIKTDIRDNIARGEYQTAADTIDQQTAPYEWLLSKQTLKKELQSGWENRIAKLMDSGQLDKALELVTHEAAWQSERQIDRDHWKDKLKQARQEAIEKLVSGREYVSALSEIRGKSNAVDSLIDVKIWETLESDLKTAWLRDAKNEHGAGRIDEALAIVSAILNEYPDMEEVQSLRETLQKTNRRGDPALVVEVIENRIRQLDSVDPAESATLVSKCDEILALFDSLGPASALSNNLRRQAVSARQHALLVRARAKSQLPSPVWEEIAADVNSLTLMVDGGGSETIAQRLVRTSLILLIENSRLQDGDLETSEILASVAEYQKNLQENVDQGQSVLTTDEIGRIDSVIVEIAASIRERIREKADQPAAALVECDQLMALVSRDPLTHMLKSDLQILLNDIESGLETLRSATPNSEQEQTQIGARIKLLADLAILRASEATIEQALKASTSVYSQLTATNEFASNVENRLWVTYGSSLVNLLESGGAFGTNPAFLKEVETALASMSNETVYASDVADLGRRLDEFKNGLRRDLEDRILADIHRDSPLDFRDLLGKCSLAVQDGETNPVIQICRAEALIATLNPKNSGDQWKTAFGIVSDDSLPISDEYEPYRSYVRGLVLNAHPSGTQWRAAADAIQVAYNRPERGVEFVGHRRNRASKVLASASKRLRRNTTSLSFVELSRSPFASPADAERAFRWLSQARDLAAEGFTKENKSVLALAAWFKEQPDIKLAAALSEEIIATSAIKTDRPIFEFPRSQLPLLHVYCRSKASGGELAALEAYAALAELAWNERNATDEEVPPLDFYKLVIRPGIELIRAIPKSTKLSASQKNYAADLYASMGQLILRNPVEQWPFNDVKDVGFKAFNDAIRYDNSKAKYYYGRGSARLKLGQYELAKVREDALAAINADSEFAGGHGLLGKVILLESREIPDLRQRPAKIEEAVKALNLAIEKARDLGEDRAFYLTSRSTAYVEWANYSVDVDKDEEVEDRLNRARDDAQQAISLNSSHQDFAYRALGNALEDLVWIAGKNKNYYHAALQAFSNAIAFRSHDAVAWMDRGRCHYKMVEFGGFGEARLEKAIQDLTRALEIDPNKAEAYYWLGKVQLKLGAETEATTNLKKSLELDNDLYVAAISLATVASRQKNFTLVDQMYAKTIAQPEIPANLRESYLVNWEKTIELYPRPSKSMTDRIPVLQASAEKISGQKSPQAFRFLAKVFVLQKKWDAAIRTYDTALTNPPSDPNVHAQLYLHRSLARYYRSDDTTVRDADLKKASKSLAIRDADRAAQLSNEKDTIATALAHAAKSRIHAANLTQNTAQQQNLLRTAVKNLRQAIQDMPKHDDGWYWRLQLVQIWSHVERGSLQKDPTKRREALKYLDEAFNSVPNTRNGRQGKQMISELRDTFRRS